MSSKTILYQNQSKITNAHMKIHKKKVNRTLLSNARLRKQIKVLSAQNKELSLARNSLSLEKISLENEKNSIKNANIQLIAMLHIVREKTKIIEENLQTCIPELATLSKYIPSMMKNVHEITKLDKFYEFGMGKKEPFTQSVNPMVKGYIIEQPVVKIRHLNLKIAPIAERRSKSYVRLKDVAALLQNSKSVTNTNSPRRQPIDNFGEGPSWLHTPKNPTHNSANGNDVTKNFKNYFVVSDKVTTLMKNEMATPAVGETSSNAVEVDLPILSLGSCISNMYDENEKRHKESFTQESRMYRNITCRKRYERKSSESSVISENESTYSLRSKRSVEKINYKEKIVHKLRRNK